MVRLQGVNIKSTKQQSVAEVLGFKLGGLIGLSATAIKDFRVQPQYL
jgi:hypothetical protein